ncbi:MAG: hypothetical protein ACI3ZF_02955 [Candidatus Cryptobacteroides sp.]
MKKIAIISVGLFSLALIGCEEKNVVDVKPAHGSLSMTLIGEAPVLAYPEDNVHYNLNVSYSEGLKSVYTSIDGVIVEGSEKTYEATTEEVLYSFGYIFSAEQIGQSIDFVFTAEGVDGYKHSIDYPVYVRSISETVTLSLPEELPSEVIMGESVEFDVKVTTGYSISKIRTLKNGEEIIDLTKTEGFASNKEDAYHFVYTTASEDGGKDIVFVFEASDVKGNFGTSDYKLHVRKGEPKALYSEIFDTQMSISGTNAFDTTEGGISGNTATQFTPANIASYNGDNAEVTDGIKEGLTVYDGDKSSINYTSDGSQICFSKYAYSTMKLISGTYVWARKAGNGWLNIAGIKLHGCTDLTLTFDQCGGSVKVEYSLDGESWTEICKSSTTDNVRADFTVQPGTESIQIRFTEDSGSAHLRFDNITLKGE